MAVFYSTVLRYSEEESRFRQQSIPPSEDNPSPVPFVSPTIRARQVPLPHEHLPNVVAPPITDGLSRIDDHDLDSARINYGF